MTLSCLVVSLSFGFFTQLSHLSNQKTSTLLFHFHFCPYDLTLWTKPTWGKTEGLVWLTLLGHKPSLREIRAGPQAGIWSRIYDGMLLASFHTGSCWTSFLIAQDFLPRNDIPNSSLDPPISINNQGNPLQTYPQINLIQLLNWDSCQVIFGCLKLTVHAN